MDTWRLHCQNAFDGDQHASALVALVETGCMHKGDHVEIIAQDPAIAASLAQLGFTVSQDHTYTLPSAQQKEYVQVKREERQSWHQRQQQVLDSDIDQVVEQSKPLALSDQDRRKMVGLFAKKHGDTLQGFIRGLAAFLHYQRKHSRLAIWDMPRVRLVTIEQPQLLLEILGFHVVAQSTEPQRTTVVIDEPEKTIQFQMNPSITDRELRRLAWALKPSHLESAAVDEFGLGDQHRDEGTVAQTDTCFGWLMSIITSIFDALPLHS
ncbi:hypothetical protein K450DRAFT_267412 [Umbelopsis ramanniana AG]|uniref:Uncharacterized protein n=1 Tax=Umbelopsis ramanniana AG TaxID=1314678 RepID=A0AAD5EJY6_UMBRA|nr:uncharacterized protein K450DRAFT_267412 [Umbelopsis ramanniana AG]KAI8584757.1 hypothetical protein K450DRAFT_267412 [Umbelopsis ramanniana AG]